MGLTQRHRFWLLPLMILCVASGMAWLAVVLPLAWLLAEED